jgi:hypothetical protein
MGLASDRNRNLEVLDEDVRIARCRFSFPLTRSRTSWFELIQQAPDGM